MRKMDMGKVATVLYAVGASFGLASAASALTTASIQGPNTPGTNTYSIVISYAAGDNIEGYGISVTTSGTYTGAFTRTAPAPFNTNAGAVVLNPPANGPAGVWAAVSGGPNGPGGTFTIGTVDITVVAGNNVAPIMRAGDGFLQETTGGFGTTIAPDSIIGLTIIPEPATAALIGFGILGLAVSGRRNRA